MRKFLMTASVFSVAMSAAALASTSTISNTESISFNNVDSVNALGDGANVTLPSTLVGGFNANELQITGTLDNSTGIAATWASEASVALNGPGLVATGAAAPTQTYTPPLAVNATFGIGTPIDPASITSFEFYETFDDGAGTDQTWLDITLTFNETTVTNGNFGVGALPGGSTVNYNGSHVSGGLDFYTFTIGGGVVDGASSLNIQTFDNTAGANAMDTELGLYDSAGNFIATDDDGQVTANGGLYSMLSFGSTDPYFNTDTAAGADGLNLPAGTYTVVVGGYNTDFTANINDIVAGTSAGEYGLDFNYIPEPATLGLMLLGFAGLVRRR